MGVVQSLGRWGINFLLGVGNAGIVLIRVFVRLPNLKKGVPSTMQQIFVAGVLSLPIVIVAGVFIGMVLGLQGYHTLAKFGAAQQLGPLVGLSVLRELGPVVTALLFAGRAGSAVTAEIGLMKATEQLSSMAMMAVDPLQRVVSPRLWAGFISLPLLTLIFNVVAIFGAYIIGVKWLGLDPGAFWSNMPSSVSFYSDTMNGIYKSIVFGFVIAWVAVFQGYSCIPTSEGIAHSTTRTVVYASLAVLGLDFVMTTMMIGGW
jgi:phospholipid/cholesterol/gamma-HCH transport system permease protein